jgi:hypothetical protein
MWEGDELTGIGVVEEEKGIVSYASLLEIDRDSVNPIGLRGMCGGGIVSSQDWQPITYDVFVSLGGSMNNTVIRLVEGGYIGRRLSWVAHKKLIPEGYCKHCAEEDNLWDAPIIGTDKKLYCNRCLRPFEPIPFKLR